ncbi:MAG: hypothetical protein FJY66_04420 [Calditrichaeota bacterium]|nr:hypothetical protein [Calditrichota bacterium]
MAPLVFHGVKYPKLWNLALTDRTTEVTRERSSGMGSEGEERRGFLKLLWREGLEHVPRLLWDNPGQMATTNRRNHHGTTD